MNRSISPFSKTAICILCSLFLTIIFTACGSSGKSKGLQVEANPEESRLSGKYDESFDPLTLKEPPFDISRKETPDNGSKVESQFVPSAAVAVQQDTSWVTVPGYQVQLLQTENGEQARETKTEATLDLDADVNIVYEAPYYKVRAGKFVNRYDAELLQSKAGDKGYLNSWIVRTPISVRAYELSNSR